MNETKETKVPRKGIVIALGIMCIILVACLGGAIAAYTLEINDKNSTISSLSSKISQLNSNVTNLQNQLNTILNGSSSIGDIIISDPSAWVNRMVIVQGVLSLVFFPVLEHAPWNFELSSGNQTIGVYISSSINMSAFWGMYNFSGYVRIFGVVEKGDITFTGGVLPPEVTYYIQAETVEPL
jgi:outer membrane murein-binding lipoprotein Lpp